MVKSEGLVSPSNEWMSRMRKKNYPAYIMSALSAFLTVGVMLLFHACGPKDDGTWMSCHYAQLTVAGLGIVMTILGVLSLVVSERKVVLALRILVLVCAVIAMVIPGNVIHLCMMNDMRCRAVMRPSVILVCVLIAAFSLLSMLSDRKKA